VADHASTPPASTAKVESPYVTPIRWMLAVASPRSKTKFTNVGFEHTGRTPARSSIFVTAAPTP
jgi:hypothetical protein